MDLIKIYNKEIIVCFMTFFVLQAVFKQWIKRINWVLTVLKFSFCKGVYNSYLFWQCWIGTREEKADLSNEGSSVL